LIIQQHLSQQEHTTQKTTIMMTAPSRNTIGTLIGVGLGTATALFVTSDYARSSRAYWWLADQVNTVNRVCFHPETSHSLAIAALRAHANPVLLPAQRTSPRLRTKVWNLEFDNPLGMAAGFDKQATAFASVLDMGYGFVEVGGVTPEPQPGNPKPRMWRLNADKAVINRLGLNSDGQTAVAQRLFTRAAGSGNQRRVVGVNIAKNSTSTSSKAGEADYCSGVKTLGALVDFIVINISCPNVQSIKDLKNDDVFQLVQAVTRERDKTCPDVPLLLKISPDLSPEGKKQIAQTAIQCGVDGLVIANTTTARDLGLQSPEQVEAGGLSGQPLKARALQTTKDMFRLTGGAIPIVGVGGIATAEDAYERIRAGASLVQMYTALVFEGPSVVPKTLQGLDALLARDGFASVKDAVGVDAN
jgi:dihydroorotate dehydrogenase